MQITEYYKASTAEDAYERLVLDSRNVILGGALWLKQTSKPIQTAIDLSALKLNLIEEEPDYYVIGSMVTLSQLYEASSLHQMTDNLLKKSLENIMGVAFRNMATIGGSVIGRFAFSDLIPPLLVLQAELVFHNQGKMPLTAFLDQKKPPKDILLQLRIPKIKGCAYFKKVSNTVLDFSILNVAIFKQDTVLISVGSRPGIGVLATAMMDYLNSAETVDETVINEAVDIGLKSIPLSDNQRGKKAYREQLLKTYLKRGLIEVMTCEH